MDPRSSLQFLEPLEVHLTPEAATVVHAAAEADGVGESSGT